MTLALVMGYLRGSSGQQAAAFIPSELRLTERPHPDSVRNVNSPPRQAGACAHLRQAQLSGRPAGPGGLPRPAGPATPQRPQPGFMPRGRTSANPDSPLPTPSGGGPPLP